MARAKPVRVETFPMFSTNNSARGVDSHPADAIEPKDFNSLSGGPIASLRSVIVPRGGMGEASKLKNGTEMPWCLQAEAILRIDTVANHSIPVDRQTLCPQNQVNQGSFTTFPNSKSRRTRSSKIHQYGGNLSRTTEKKRDSGPNPNVPVDSSGRRSLFSPQNAKNNQSHKIITIAQQLTDTSQPSTNTMTMQRAMNANFPPYEQPTQSASRPKSESINIKRLKGYDDSSHFDNSAERMYDWATWRMYHRITTARRSRASVVPYGTNNIKAVTDTSAHCSNLTHESDGHLSDRTPSLASLDYELEDEVFEIEI